MSVLNGLGSTPTQPSAGSRPILLAALSLPAIAQVSYAIGRPFGIIKMLDLVHPMYQQTASNGHFGRKPYDVTDKNGNTFTAFSWEKTNKAEILRDAAGLGAKAARAK